ncbi:cytochrome b [Acidihalobacter ferrooxydans]|uniref:Cytochrome b561 bacterial/Ni-hydrogenase domain-containing protein n=1 Tax=Acidihalobacter ferrooxydans TaxID=1765967 RepID=A0A1P8UGV1_9GAMM|nr:cytochrome b/b6 domain-containing protein [Acidihalobacter ferrooxydans]APZ43073.1 hypothetical protein BW247_08195 [Acidihalobacter ferrooxydans]
MTSTLRHPKNDAAQATPRSLTSRSLHWLITLLVIFQGLLGYANLHVAWFHERLATGMLVHEEAGLILLGLTLWMLMLRWIEGRRPADGLSKRQAQLAGMMHAALYLLIFIQSALGIWMMGLLGRGLTLFFWHVGLPITADPRLVFGGVLQIHAAVAALLAFAIVVHALAAFHHHFVLRDNVLRHMLPWRTVTSRIASSR